MKKQVWIEICLNNLLKCQSDLAPAGCWRHAQLECTTNRLSHKRLGLGA